MKKVFLVLFILILLASLPERADSIQKACIGHEGQIVTVDSQSVYCSYTGDYTILEGGD